MPLPADVLADIFVLTLQGNGVHLKHGPRDAPWTFLKVNSRWRQVALNEHRLWRALIAEGPMTSTQGWLENLWLSPGSAFLVSLDLRRPYSTINIIHILSTISFRLLALSIEAPCSTIFELLQHAPLSFENLEAITLISTETPPADNPSLTLFSRVTRLHTVEMVGDDPSLSRPIFCFPWNQLTTLRFVGRFYPLTMIHSLISQCPRLIHVEAYTRDSPVSLQDLPATKPPSEIVLLDLRELTYVVESWYSLDGFFDRLKMPYLKSLAVRGNDFSPFSPDSQPSYPFPQAEFLAMLDISLSIETLLFGCKIQEDDLIAVLRKTPNLATLLVSMIIPSNIFNMIARGDLLPKLGRLECKTKSLSAFLDLLEQQCSYIDPLGYRGIHTAHIMYPCIGDMSYFSRRLRDLKPILLMDGKKIVFKAGSLSSKFFLRYVCIFYPKANVCLFNHNPVRAPNYR